MLKRGLKRSFLFFLSNCMDLYTSLSVRSFYRSFYSPGGYKPETLTQYLSRMAKVGEIEKKIINGKVVFAITTKGEKLLDQVIPLRKLEEKKWDGWWRIVIFDIEEKKKYLRDRVREKLLGLGFGKWQESVYISPHPMAEEMNEYFEEKDLYPSCVCLEARETGKKDNKLLAEQIFKLNELTSNYKNIIKDIDLTTQLIKENKFSKAEAIEKLHIYLEKYELVLMRDPFLPEELWVEYPIREKTKKYLTDLTQNVAKSI
ncbi:hypothetical protein A2954_04595 [Candidatus Roizmanbacteria bacterium RIFCSPLOWO2_01_FULL_37_12]|uniref:Uncharacterized protein n=1 Tax=Candidatus Roizmanbacteria bacterium RIFCSPLOWO2_01_FULL_37_12 TaxID=1802056 RepID=A0A1F7IFZ6_9BACT|nr:MAG: hypothetical protein A2954_04595 [Candidatus Roizmanbacteria bacterium RIFCSPLOWO2_01_FULL_37_12]